MLYSIYLYLEAKLHRSPWINRKIVLKSIYNWVWKTIISIPCYFFWCRKYNNLRKRLLSLVCEQSMWFNNLVSYQLGYTHRILHNVYCRLDSSMICFQSEILQMLLHMTESACYARPNGRTFSSRLSHLKPIFELFSERLWYCF